MGEDDPRMLVNTLFSLFGKYVSPQGGEECRELRFSQLEVSRKNKTKVHVFFGKKIMLEDYSTAKSRQTLSSIMRTS